MPFSQYNQTLFRSCATVFDYAANYSLTSDQEKGIASVYAGSLDQGVGCVEFEDARLDRTTSYMSKPPLETSTNLHAIRMEQYILLNLENVMRKVAQCQGDWPGAATNSPQWLRRLVPLSVTVHTEPLFLSLSWDMSPLK